MAILAKCSKPMEKDRAIQVIEAEIASTTSSELSELIYEIVVEKEIDKKAIRNKVIKADFNSLYKTEMSIMDIYTTLSYSHNLSERTINYIVAK